MMTNKNFDLNITQFFFLNKLVPEMFKNRVIGRRCSAAYIKASYIASFNCWVFPAHCSRNLVHLYQKKNTDQSLILSQLKYFFRSVLIDLIVYDKHLARNRFNLVYVFASLCFNKTIMYFKKAGELQPISSITAFFPNADWLEREAFDLFGILFLAHTNLRRILTDYGFIGHPFRKDFPIVGFKELTYDDSIKKIKKQPVEFSQEFRYFDY